MQGRVVDGSFRDRGRDAVLIENGGVRRSVRTREYLLTWHGPKTRGELYDLQTDPDCFVNLWNEDSASALKTEALDTLLNLMAGNIDPRHQQVGAC
jgi:hypothetical protein